MGKLNTKTTILLGVVGVSAALIGIAACSSDDVVIPADEDSGTTSDSGVTEDTGTGPSDTGVADTGIVADSGVVEDSGLPDTGADAGPDFDAGSQEFDGGIVQNPLSPEEFITSMAQIFCVKAKGCCGAIAETPAFDLNKCVDVFKLLGWEGSATGTATTGVLASGHLTFNSVVAKACLRGISQVSCVNSAAAFKQVTQDCFNAFVGNQPIGASCVKTIECVPGTYCAKPLVDGGPAGDLGVGQCAALKNIGDTCNYDLEAANNALPIDECTYRSSGTPAAYCSKSAGNKCVAAVATGVLPPDFSPNQVCAPGILNAPDPVTYGDLTCGGTQALVFKETCDKTYAVTP